jgi:hypothetical protein
MNIEFTQQDLQKLDELIQQTPFKYALPFFQFFQVKVKETQDRQLILEGKARTDGNQTDG